jgi:broad specificity phosphatase PhoE
MNTPTSENDAPREIWLIRHGETEWSRSGQHTGRTNIQLTPHGREQARSLAPVLAAQPFDRVLTSPRSRAIDTCREAGMSGQAEQEADLREWDYGIYEGLTTPEIRERVLDWSVWSSPVPEGESLEQIQARAQSLIERLMATSHRRVALFSHAHFLRVFAGCWIGNSAALGAHLALDTASISVLGFDRENRAIRQWNMRYPVAD